MSAVSENQSKIDSKSSEKPVSNLTGYQTRKYEQTVRPFKNLPMNRRLLEIAYTWSPAEFMCTVKLWDWFQSKEIKTTGFRFMLSRAHLAEITGASEKVTQSTLSKLKRCKALVGASTKFGVTEYVWNVAFLYRGVSLKDTAPVSKRYGPCIQEIRPLYPEDTASIICTLVLPSLLPSYTRYSGHAQNVDNSVDASELRSSLGELKVALRAGLPKETLKEALRAGLSFERVVGLADGILNTWIGADRGGTSFLQDILIVLRTWQVNLYTSEDISGDLFKLMKDSEATHTARKKIRNYFESEDELLDHLFELHQTGGEQ